MRTSIHTILTAVLLVLSGCATPKPALLASNAINEPVFHKTTNLALGISRTQWIDPATGKDSNDGIFNLNLLADYPVNDWAGFSFLPVFWNFLLTGEQYRDSLHLQVNKLNLAVGGGLSGFSYSSRNGWDFPASVSANAKYLFDEHLFANTAISAQLTDIADRHNGQVRTCIGIGSQLTEEIALVATTNFIRVFASPFHYYSMHGVPVFDGDVTNTSGIGLSWYPTPKHVLGASIDHFQLVNAPGSTSRWLISGQYTYVLGGR